MSDLELEISDDATVFWAIHDAKHTGLNADEIMSVSMCRGMSKDRTREAFRRLIDAGVIIVANDLRARALITKKD